MATPYHTGKVQIGAAYMRQQRPHHDADALRLQRALIGERASTDWDGIAIAVVCIIIVAMLALVLAWPIAG